MLSFHSKDILVRLTGHSTLVISVGVGVHGCPFSVLAFGLCILPAVRFLFAKVQNQNISCLKGIYSCDETYLFINLLALHPIFNASEELALLTEYSHVRYVTAVLAAS